MARIRNAEAAARPVIIIGAGRSGTNMLRDLLVQMPGLVTWPCDEINYIWRHGNARYPTDEFPADVARPDAVAAIQRDFAKLVKGDPNLRVVEKTCANSLRVHFVDRVFPRAQFISIVRDGRDVAASAMKRWTAPLDLPYLARKARFVPAADVPYYGLRYLQNRLHRLRSGEERLSSWGPRFEGMDAALRTRSLAEVCALQWRRCVEHAEEDLAALDDGRVFRLSYETFVRGPAPILVELADFLQLRLTLAEAQAMTASVSANSIGRWQNELSEQELASIEPIIASLFAVQASA